MLRRWGHFAATHHWWVIGTWVVLVPALWVLGLAVGGEPDNTFTLPGSPSQDAQDRLEADFPAAAGASATVVYHSRTGADLTTDTSVQQEIEASLARSEEHTSELQSRENLVCRLLLEKKKKNRQAR